jgi:hypothetical protein
MKNMPLRQWNEEGCKLAQLAAAGKLTSSNTYWPLAYTFLGSVYTLVILASNEQCSKFCALTGSDIVTLANLIRHPSRLCFLLLLIPRYVC